jgi:hypothetical protein
MNYWKPYGNIEREKRLIIINIVTCETKAELNAWDGQMICWLKSFTKRKKNSIKRWRKKSDPICGQYTNACKLIAK